MTFYGSPALFRLSHLYEYSLNITGNVHISFVWLSVKLTLGQPIRVKGNQCTPKNKYLKKGSLEPHHKINTLASDEEAFKEHLNILFAKRVTRTGQKCRISLAEMHKSEEAFQNLHKDSLERCYNNV